MASGSSSNLQKLRSLLPAASTEPEVRDLVPTRHSILLDRKKRRARVTAACGQCRDRKAKCSGDRPRCSECVTRQIDCSYDTAANETQAKAIKRKYEELQKNNKIYERIFEVLRSRSDTDAGVILQKIRRGDDINDVARHIEYADLLLQVSLAPETRYRYVFPISPSMPAHLLQPSNAYLDSLIYEWVWPQTTNPPTSPIRRPREASDEADAPYLKPYHAAEIIDARLSAAEPSKWTTVCRDDALMRRLLSAFFLQDHDWWTCFHKDYFLQDMIKMHHQLCSPLLVNAVLAISCCYYRGLDDRAEFWNPNTLGYRFLAEAKRLWDYEQDKNRLTTIQAGLLINIVYSEYGADQIGWVYTINSCAMAHNIGLFTTSTTIKNDRLREARDYTAWSLFCWQSLICFHYFRTPLLDQAPAVPLPDPVERPEWYGETWLKYPLSMKLYPSHSGLVFKAKADFAIIMNDLARRLYTGASQPEVLSATDAAEFYSRFKKWYDTLPDELSSRQIVLPSHFKLHMHYFQLLLRLLRALDITDEEGSETEISLKFGTSPQQIINHCNVSLETLLRAYFLRHGFEWMDSYLCSFLTDVCFMAIHDMNASSSHENTTALQSSIVLFAKGVYDQGQSFFVGQLMFELVRKKLRLEDFELLKRFIKIEPIQEIQTSGLAQVQMEWPVEIISVTENPDAKRINSLVKKFKEASLDLSSEDSTE